MRNGRGVVRRFHWWTGVVASLGMLVLTVTGLVLLHPEWLRGDTDAVDCLATDPATPGRILRVSSFLLEESTDGGETWRDLPLPLVPADPVACRFARDRSTVWLMGGSELLVSRDGGRVWEFADLPPGVGRDNPARDLAVDTDGAPLVLTDREGWAWTGPGDWRLLWSRPVTGSERSAAWVRVLHTGHWGPPWVARVYDGLAVLVLVVIATGMAVAVRRRRNGNGRKP